MARKSEAKGILNIATKDHETLYCLIDYLEGTKDHTEYYIDLVKNDDLDGLKKDGNEYSFSCDFNGIGRWQFNATLNKLGDDMENSLDPKTIEKLKANDFKMVFDFCDIEKIGEIFYKSKITLDHKNDTDLSCMTYQEDDLQFLKINQDELEVIDIDKYIDGKGKEL